MYQTAKLVLILVLILVLCTTMLFGCSAVSQAGFDTPDKIAESAIEEFLAFSKIPRASRHTQKALAYLQEFATETKYEYSTDDYGNFWMDIPATKGYEGYPKVILQTHMDMVLVGEDGKEIDSENTGVITVVNENTITAEGTSLGADNGIGVGIVLAIARSNIEHGPIRILVTTDEEIGPQGASKLTPEVIDADYLINIDGEDNKEIYYSCAGCLEVSIKKLYETSPMNTQHRMYQLSINGLMGGHSGIDINKNRLSANIALMEIMDAVQKVSTGVYLSEIESGIAMNAIASNGSVTFAIAANDEESMKQAVSEVEQSLKKQFPHEKIECVLKEVLETELTVISAQESSDLIALARSFPQGVLAMNQKVEGLIETSSNIGVIKLEKGNVEIINFARSSINSKLDQLNADFKILAQKYGYEHHLSDLSPAYDGDPNSPLVKLVKQSYESLSLEPELVGIHGNLEFSWFDAHRSAIQMTSIGPKIENAHSTREVLYIDTVAPVVNAVVYCLKNINRI